MTSTTIRAARAAGSGVGSYVDQDLQLLADQMQRCATPHTRRQRWRGFAVRLGAFTSQHVMSLACAGGALASLWFVLR